MISALHVATGALAGALIDSRAAALASGPPLHLACDAVPHHDTPNRRFEIASGVCALLVLTLSRGPLDPATLGGGAAAAADLEHVFAPLRPRGRKVFHDRLGWHRSGGLGTGIQFLAAGAIIGALVRVPQPLLHRR